MSDYEYTEQLIARYNESYTKARTLTDKEYFKLIRIMNNLVARGFRFTGNSEDWMPPFTLDAE